MQLKKNVLAIVVLFLSTVVHAESLPVISLDTKVLMDPSYVNNRRIGVENIPDYEFLGSYREVVKDAYYDTPDLILNSNNHILRRRHSFSKGESAWVLKRKQKLGDSIVESSEIKFRDEKNMSSLSDRNVGSEIEYYLKVKFGIKVSELNKIYSDQIIRYKYFFKNKENDALLIQISFDHVSIYGEKKCGDFFEMDISSTPFKEHAYVIKKLKEVRNSVIGGEKKLLTNLDESKYGRGLKLIKDCN